MSDVEYSIASDQQTTVTMGDGAAEVVTSSAKGLETEVEEGVSRRRAQEAAGLGGDGEDSSDADVSDDDLGDDGSEEGGDDENGEDTVLPEAFNADDPETVAAFEQAYLKDGELNEDALSAEYFANVEKGQDGLNEATYEFLKSKGISKATAKRVEALLVNEADAAKNSSKQQDFALFEVAGGSDSLKDMLKWGKDGGYSADQQKRFNDVMKGTDLEAKKEAVELLKSRFSASDASRPTQPKRDATKGNGKPSNAVKPFANRTEWREARRAAGDNREALRKVDARAKASGF
ncbi:hypothetical protein IB276_22470 [Ensifer sp. ENS04]|uniref:hypothetical protein n=1 Tax=Ensifer sp. ENS04 TaxID=2769281 RepID=UPI001781EE6B|nr:hypothetical protein [Ensifer sp. ENS04]MBD9542213.1 hypothetical protein [Ensifer sp. ENS04]